MGDFNNYEKPITITVTKDGVIKNQIVDNIGTGGGGASNDPTFTPFFNPSTPISFTASNEKFEVPDDIWVIDVSSYVVNSVDIYNSLSDLNNGLEYYRCEFKNNFHPFYLKKGQCIRNSMGASMGAFDVVFYGFPVQQISGGSGGGSGGGVEPIETITLPFDLTTCPINDSTSVRRMFALDPWSITPSQFDFSQLTKLVELLNGRKNFRLELKKEVSGGLFSVLATSIVYIFPNYHKLRFTVTTPGQWELTEEYDLQLEWDYSNFDNLRLTRKNVIKHENQKANTPKSGAVWDDVSSTYLNAQNTANKGMYRITCSSTSGNHSFLVKINDTSYHSQSGLPNTTSIFTFRMLAREPLAVSSPNPCRIEYYYDA